MQEHKPKHRQTQSRNLQKIVGSALKANETDYKLANVAYIWLIRDFNKKSLPDGRWSGIVYTGTNMRSGCVMVYTTCKDQIDWADDCNVMTMWTNPKHIPVDDIVVNPREIGTGYNKPRKSVNNVKFEDVIDEFFKLRDDPEMSITESAKALKISYSKYFVWYKKYENHTIDNFLTIR